VLSAQAKATSLGFIFEGNSTRELTSFRVSCLEEKTPEAIAFLGEVIGGKIDQTALESARSKILSLGLITPGLRLTRERVLTGFFRFPESRN